LYINELLRENAISTNSNDLHINIEQVITDVIMLNEKSPLPVGYAFIGEYIDPKITVPKKKRLCMKLTPIHTAESAVAELKLTVKNKSLGAPYTRLGDMSGLALWCKKVPVTSPKPTPKPRNITTGVRGLSLDSNSPAQPVKNEVPAPKLSRGSSITEHPIYESNVYGISDSYLPRWMQHWTNATSVPRRLCTENRATEHRRWLGSLTSPSGELLTVSQKKKKELHSCDP
ncbi:hypothetical protein AB205_0073770, partial [Aquarana catesbeiana]